MGTGLLKTYRPVTSATTSTIKNITTVEEPMALAFTSRPSQNRGWALEARERLGRAPTSGTGRAPLRPLTSRPIPPRKNWGARIPSSSGGHYFFLVRYSAAQGFTGFQPSSSRISRYVVIIRFPGRPLESMSSIHSFG